MPNSQTDWFTVEQDLILLHLGNVRFQEPAGISFGDMNTVVDIDSLRQRLPCKPFSIEEQHWSSYIHHIGEDMQNWVLVSKESPIFPVLMHMHLYHRQASMWS